jgi:hypothetical protein
MLFPIKKYAKLLLLLCIFILIIFVFKMIHYLSTNKYIVECFNTSTSHTVDLPLTNKYSCKNFCGPTARCSITGQQCFADIDCPGCQPSVPGVPRHNTDIPGDDGAGKLTLGVTPQYSSLTSGFGTKEQIINKNMSAKPLQPKFGVNTWLSSYNVGQELFNKRYKPKNLMYMPNYDERYNMLGDNTTDEPYASNSYLP